MVVLKTPVDPQDYDYFRREVKWWRTLSGDPARSTHLVRCTAFLRLERKPFAVLEFVNGPNLRNLLNRESGGRLSVSQTLIYGMQFCLGMEEASQRTVDFKREAKGFAHRDICPENIMIAWDADPSDGHNLLKINDFGLARPLTQDAAARRRGRGFAGRPNYAAPEIFEGSFRAAVASDIYAFGVTLWEMLTGSLPYEMEDSEALEDFRWRILRQPIPSLGDHRSGAPAPLDRILDTCLQKLPETRYPSFEMLQEDLRRLSKRVVGTGLLADENVQCRSCGYIPPAIPGDGRCVLCESPWETVPATMA
jgi:serine/threonine protein kinase